MRSMMAALLLAVANRATAGKKPNVLVILADDMGQWATSAYGNSELTTPVLDSIAANGHRFTNAVCNTPVCSASRASYLTGRLPTQHGVEDWISGGNGCNNQPAIQYMPTSQEAWYSDEFKKAGYFCGISGKLHTGAQNETNQHGFEDHWFVHQSGGGSYRDPPLVINGTCDTLHDVYITDVLAEDAISAIRGYNAKDPSTPWLHLLHFTSPHSPYTGPDGRCDSMHPKGLCDKYLNATFRDLPRLKEYPYAYHTSGLTEGCLTDRQCWAGYYAATEAMDTAIGTVLDSIRSLGIENDTVVTFASDHGFSLTHHGVVGKGNSFWPLNAFDTALKIPLMIMHPGSIAGGVTRQEPVMVVDFATTLLGYVGLSFPKKDNVAGRDYSSLLLSPGEADRIKDRIRKSRSVSGGGLLRHSSRASSSSQNAPLTDSDSELLVLGLDAEDSLTFHEYGEMRAIRGGGYKLIHRENSYDELFDLKNDPNETTNMLPTALPVLSGAGVPAYPGGAQAYPANLTVVGGRSGLEAASKDGQNALALAQTLLQTGKQYFSFFSDPYIEGSRQFVTGRGQRQPVYYGRTDVTYPSFDPQNLRESSRVDSAGGSEGVGKGSSPFDGKKGDDWAPFGPVPTDDSIEDHEARWASQFDY